MRWWGSGRGPATLPSSSLRAMGRLRSRSTRTGLAAINRPNSHPISLLVFAKVESTPSQFVPSRHLFCPVAHVQSTRSLKSSSLCSHQTALRPPGFGGSFATAAFINFHSTRHRSNWRSSLLHDNTLPLNLAITMSDSHSDVDDELLALAGGGDMSSEDEGSRPPSRQRSRSQSVRSADNSPVRDSIIKKSQNKKRRSSAESEDEGEA